MILISQADAFVEFKKLLRLLTPKFQAQLFFFHIIDLHVGQGVLIDECVFFNMIGNNFDKVQILFQSIRILGKFVDKLFQMAEQRLSLKTHLVLEQSSDLLLFCHLSYLFELNYHKFLTKWINRRFLKNAWLRRG